MHLCILVYYSLRTEVKDYRKWEVFYAACFINNFTTCVAELEYNNNETADAKHTSSSSPNNTVSAI